ncbi:MAG: DUF5686 family protein [Bacteroidales bacterium]
MYRSLYKSIIRGKSEITTLCLISLLIFPLLLQAQPDTLKGVIKNAETLTPLPFAHIVAQTTGKGVTSNAQGEFTLVINRETPGERFIISYVGFHSDTLIVDRGTPNFSEWLLKPSPYSLEEATITPGPNPADRIIRQLIGNRQKWSPANLQSYAYEGYHKMRFGPYFDTTFTAIKPVESTLLNFSKNDVFLIETATEKFVEPPNRVHETMKAFRISGTTNPLFSYLNTQLQSLSFYNNFFSILDRKYISPLSKKAFDNYRFHLEDTLFHAQYDTIYVISYRPKSQDASEGLAGLLQVSTQGYALAGATAKTTNKEDNIRVNVFQKYEKINQQQWFPTELRTQILFEELLLQEDPPVYLQAEASSNLYNIRINPKLSDTLWSKASLEYAPELITGDDPQWQQYRKEDLTARDSLTYHVIDSLGRVLKLDMIMGFTEILLSGNLRIKSFDLPIHQLIRFNQMEGFRPGLGLQTNELLHDHWTLGGFVGYGFKDETWKYGGNISYFFNRAKKNFLEFSYKKDVEERGGLSFLGLNRNMGTEVFRPFLVKHFEYNEEFIQRFQFWAKRNLMLQANLRQANYYSNDGYYYQPDIAAPKSHFQCYTVSLHGRFAPAEKQLKTHTRLFPLGSRYPMLFFNISKALPLKQSQSDYLKISGRLNYTYRSPTWGDTYLSITGGWMKGNAPAVRLFNGQGSYNQFSLQADNSFATMRMNEFFATKFLHFHLKHDFGALLYRATFSAPHILLMHGMAIGHWDNQQQHQFPYPVKDLTKGYLESGIMISNLLKTSIIGYGVGAFYRYGPYALPEVKENLGYKLVLSITL